MNRPLLIELQKERMKFSVAHFTIFSADNREAIHGHNYTVYLSLLTPRSEYGLNFDYRFYKEKVYALCDRLNQSFLLPSDSPYLIIEDNPPYYLATFNNHQLQLLKTDVTLLPLANITVEALSQWFLQQLIADHNRLEQHKITQITVKIFSLPGQSGAATWEQAR